MDLDAIAAIIAEANAYSSEVDTSNILPPCIIKCFSKVKDSAQVVEFGLAQPMLSLASFFVL